MPEQAISHEQAEAVRGWIAQIKGKGLTDDMIGARAYSVDGEPLIVTTIKNPGDVRTWKLVASTPIFERLAADQVLKPKQQ